MTVFKYNAYMCQACFLHTHTHAYVHVFVCVCASVRVCTGMCVREFVYGHTSTQMHAQTCKHTHMHTEAQTYTYTHIQVFYSCIL